MLDRASFKVYLRYIIPSTLSFLLSAIYSIVDGLFVGQTTGDTGLAGINVAYPLVALVLAVGTGIGMGGAVVSSIRQGNGQLERARRTVGHTLTFLVAVVPILTVILLVFGKDLLYLMGGRGEILQQAEIYLSVLAWSAVFQVLGAGSIPLIRNKGKVNYALAAMLTGGTANCILDYVFVVVFGLGVFGAALATAIAQALVFLFALVFFLRRANRPRLHDLGLQFDLVVRTLKVGFAPFALTLLPEITTLLINITAEQQGGGTAQAAFAVISYVGVSVQWIIQGINDGSQPLVSKCFGAGDIETVYKLRRTNYLFAVGTGLVGTALVIALRPQLAAIFGISQEATEVFMSGMVLFASALAFYGITHATTSFFYAVENNRSASMLIIGEAVLMVAATLTLPNLLGLNGVWLTVTVTQVLLSVFGILLLVKGEHNLQLRMAAEYEKASEHPTLAELA